MKSAGKFWQRNWEYHVDLLEERALGPLYKTVLEKKRATHFSASKINAAISLYVAFLLLCGAAFFSGISNLFEASTVHVDKVKLAIFLLNLGVLALIYWTSRTDFSKGKSKLDIDVSGTQRRIFLKKIEAQSAVSDSLSPQ